MKPVSRGIDRIAVTFDEPNLVANAGLLLIGTLVGRLGLERLINATLRFSGRVGGAAPGRKVLTLVHAMAAGGSHIDHADVLRSGATAAVLPHRVMAPSTLGTFLRAFTFGHVRQLDAVLAEALRRAWAMRAGPGSAQMVMDLDSTICEVCGKAKGGAGYGYTKKLGYHPLLATRADTGEVLHVRMRKGAANTQRGAVRFVEELVARVRRAGATGELIMRFDSGFWSNTTIATLERLEVGYTMGVRMIKSVLKAVAAIDESTWTPIEYTKDGEAQVAECDYKGRRLIVRRTRLIGRQATLWPEWRHFAFLTDLEGHPVDIDAFHRAHANVELAIRDLKEGSGLEHVPFGKVLRQRGLAPLRRSRARPHPLDRHARQDHTQRPAHRGAHRAHPVLVRSRTPRQSFGHSDTTHPARMAMGRALLTRAQPLAQPAAGPRVEKHPAGGAPQTMASGADIGVHQLEACLAMPRLVVAS